MSSAHLQRARFSLRISLLIITSVCLTIWLRNGSASPAATNSMPALHGEGAVSYLKDRALYDSLQSAITNTMFSQLQKLTAPDGGTGDFLGGSVAISGDTAVLGASPVSAVYVFVKAGGVWSLQQKLQVAGGSAFGISVAIDGNTLVVGASGEDLGTGAAHVFVRSGVVWNEQQRLIASDGVEENLFGISVGVSGNTVVVGARFSRAGAHPQQGSAYVFVRSGGVWSEQQHLTADDGGVAEFYGDGVAISGDTIVVAAAGIDQMQQLEPGSAYVYVRASGVWSLQQRLTSDATGPGLFGSFVTIEGDTIVVGALFGNSAYVFTRTGGVWSQQTKFVKQLIEFGISASISGDTIVVGARHQNIGDNSSQGAAYVFVKAGGVWSEQQMLISSDGAANDRFGYSVAISGDAIVIGAPFAQIGANEVQGSVYLYTPNTPPTISVSPVAVQQGRAVTGASIATVSDNETSSSSLTVSVISGGTATGITLTNIGNASGAITANIAASCTATSGTVRLRVTDTGGLTSAADLQVNVAPNDPPVTNCPGNIVKPADPGLCSAVVAFTATASDDCDGALVPICMPPSGSTFARGTTTVTCTATDSSRNATSCRFTVTVNDTRNPTIACPASFTALAARPGDATAIISYAAPTAADNCAVQSVICTPPSGSAFPLGATTVSCTATDTSGNTVSCTFSVTVFDVCLQDDTNPSTAIVWNSLTGDYRFCCGGVIYRGRAAVSRKASVFTLTDNASDRRLIAGVDSTQNKGTAALQAPPGVNRGTIIDRDIRNNFCQCALNAVGP